MHPEETINDSSLPVIEAAISCSLFAVGSSPYTSSPVSAMYIAETADFGILRAVVSEPEKAYELLKENHFAVNVTDVVGISCPNIPGALAKVLQYLTDEGVFIEYMYSFANGDHAHVVIRPSDMDGCLRVLKEHRVELLAASDLYKL